MALIKTMRWFGPDDPISLGEIRQTGVQGVVTALHHIANGEVWPRAEIASRRALIEAEGLEWKVVESVPVHELIKLGAGGREEKIANYCETLRNLGAEGIEIVTYNFMTVVDWVRTSLAHKLPNGRRTMYLDQCDLAVFDIHILKRPGAADDHPPTLRAQASARHAAMTAEQIERLVRTIAVDSQNFIDGTLSEGGRDPIATFRDYISQYAGIDKQMLRSNAKFFLDSVIPIAESVGIRMAIHPDDPPRPVFGLARIASTSADFDWLMRANKSPANSIALCTGSLSAVPGNDVVEMVARFADRLHFVHLRNTRRDESGNFWESEHLDGVVDMPAVMRILLEEQRRRERAGGRAKARIYLRPDHGQMLLDDFSRDCNPGYPLIGRMKALAELAGLERGIEYMLDR
jgi:mannonate dehydratase